MNCVSTKKWLLDADSLQKANWPSEVAGHVKACAGCAALARKLRKIESNLRDQPLPPECAKSKKAFLKKFHKLDRNTTPASADPPAKSAKSRWFRPSLWLPASGVGMAAAVLIGVSILTWMLLAPTPSQANTDILDRLVDWNIELANADLAKRKEMVQERGLEFRTELQKVQILLTEDERELAEQLIDSGEMFAVAEDPVAEVERITELREKLSERAEVAEKRGKPHEFERCGNQFGKFNAFTKKYIDMRAQAFKAPPMQQPWGNKKGGPEHWANMKKQFERFAERERERERENPRGFGKRPPENFGKKGWPKFGKK